ncbi:MAG: hypothetical protein IIC73_00660 [Armatimonadetes bacterium]|nr:hypothetical protein [Armatimonadota bacterium]
MRGSQEQSKPCRLALLASERGGYCQPEVQVAADQEHGLDLFLPPAFMLASRWRCRTGHENASQGSRLERAAGLEMVNGTHLISIYDEHAREFVRRYTRVTARDDVSGPRLNHRHTAVPVFVSSSHKTVAAVRPAAANSIDIVV